MIIFRGLREDNRGIDFESLEDIRAVVKIVDGYTGLCSYAGEMDLSRGITYFFSHPIRINHRRFEIWDINERTLYLKIDFADQSSINLQNLDKFGSLKNFIYDNKKDREPALPLYEIFCTQIYDRGEKCQVKENDIVFDIGGNLGLFSYYSICKGAKEVHCFEPSPTSYSAIRENFSFENLFIENKAVTSETGEIEFYNNDSSSINSSAYIINEGCTKIICKSISLPDYIKEKDIVQIDYLKIDCEGAEYDIIESLDEYFLSTSVRSMCIEYHLNRDGKIYPMIEKLQRCGFTIEFEYNPEQINAEMGIFYAFK